MLAFAMAGPRSLKRWGEVAAEVDFYDLKGVMEELLDRLNLEEVRFERRRDQDLFHPGRTAVIERRGLRLGVLGELHPSVARNFELRVPVFLAEIDLGQLLGLVGPDLLRVAPPPRFPTMRRDLAVVVEEQVSASELLDVIRRAGGPLLAGVELFDLFRGEGVPSGRKSCGFRLIFRSPERTLTDAEVAEVEAHIIEQLGRLTGARIRG